LSALESGMTHQKRYGTAMIRRGWQGMTPVWDIFSNRWKHVQTDSFYVSIIALLQYDICQA
jgi:hypothetical protein